MAGKIHLVYDSNYSELKEALEEEGYEVIWDYSLNSFKHFSMNKETDAMLALVNISSGIIKKQEAYELLKEIRKNLPDLRIIIQMPENMKYDRIFIEKIIGLGIYDLRFAKTFDIDDIKYWFRNRMTLADHELTIQTNIDGNVERDTEFFAEEKQEEAEEKETKSYNIFSKKKETEKRTDNPFKKNISTVVSNMGNVFGNVRERLKTEKAHIPYPETICVYSSKGGTGSTTVLLHLAQLYAKENVRVGVVDLAFPFGQIGSYINVSPSLKVKDVLNDCLYHSEEEWKQIIVEDKGIQYFLPPNQWDNGFKYTVGLVDKIIRNMQRSQTITLIDMQNTIDLDAQLMVFSLSSKIYWILDMNKTTLFNAHRQRIKLKEHGFHDSGKIKYILNRVKSKDINIDAIEDALEGKVILSIEDMDKLPSAMNKSRFSKELMDKLTVCIT